MIPITRAPVRGLAFPLLLSCAGPGPVGPGQNPLSPPPSAGHELVYHDSLRLVLLVNAGLGGHDDARMAGQRTRLWSWAGSRWSVLDSAGPPVRNLGGVAYDARRNKLVVYGGTFSANLSYSDTWEWDRNAGWRQFQVSGPGIRDHTQMTYARPEPAARRRHERAGPRHRLPGMEWDKLGCADVVRACRALSARHRL